MRKRRGVRPGHDDIAFMAGPVGNRSLAIASTATGRIATRITFNKGAVNSLAASKNGQTLHIGAPALPSIMDARSLHSPHLPPRSRA